MVDQDIDHFDKHVSERNGDDDLQAARNPNLDPVRPPKNLEADVEEDDEGDNFDWAVRDFDQDIIECRGGFLGPFLELNTDQIVEELRDGEGEDDVDQRGEVLRELDAEDFDLQRWNFIEAERELRALLVGECEDWNEICGRRRGGRVCVRGGGEHVDAHQQNNRPKQRRRECPHAREIRRARGA
jgi:hypothetical protein